MQLRITAPTRLGGRFLRLTMLAAAALVAMVLVSSQVAHASSIRKIHNEWTGRCVGVAASMTVPFPETCAYGSAQSWVTTTVYTHVDTFKNAMTATCLDDSSLGLRLVTCNGLNYQEWRVTWYGAWAELRNVHTNRCLDDTSGHGLRAAGCNGGAWQRWQVPIV
ncbi:hypothetical protein Athai_45120 [Actinocatenispora thailandica]|uniref:Ricin B lectin domain-containing protein n=1 Tax=Actinocatenispora thailandica TaxID=227318 RepID=A0A7R7HZ62_9ACTN|nr:ricin-type beta-trefoil lectin domain protein [Actinocatenispora thailandica]BCJ37009.1 hypothetical protein Athai_45120 [Actinocatenispora thailandica]